MNNTERQIVISILRSVHESSEILGLAASYAHAAKGIDGPNLRAALAGSCADLARRTCRKVTSALEIIEKELPTIPPPSPPHNAAAALEIVRTEIQRASELRAYVEIFRERVCGSDHDEPAAALRKVEGELRGIRVTLSAVAQRIEESNHVDARSQLQCALAETAIALLLHDGFQKSYVRHEDSYAIATIRRVQTELRTLSGAIEHAQDCLRP